MIYEFVRERTDYPAARWLEHLQVSRSGYYEYVDRREAREAARNARKAEIKRIFEESRGTYGPDRICGELRSLGKTASYNPVSTMMKEMGLSSIHNKTRTRSLTDSRKARNDEEMYPNLIRGQTIDKPLRAVCSDITHLPTPEGWEYLCTVKDIATGCILGHSMGSRMTEELTANAFLNAHAKHNIGIGTIFHSDRGSQYTAKGFRSALAMYGVSQSFSRVGYPGDNAWAESFFAVLKKECVHLRQFPTREALRAVIFEWIEVFYNNRRIQKRLGYRSPKEYAAMLTREPHAA